MLRPWVLALTVAAIVPAMGCVSVTTAPRDRAPSAGAVALDGVPVLDFPPDRCGPGALAAVLAFHGDSVTLEELDEQLPRGRRDGVLSIDLLLAARARGYQARLVQGDADLLRRSIAEGNPPILLLRVVDIPGAKRDYFHYIVVDGYDAERGLVRLHFGDGKTRWGRLEKLDGAWSGTDRATLLVQPPAQPAEELQPPDADPAVARGAG